MAGAQGGDAEDRTESGTARRMQQARDDGQAAISREFGALALLGSLAAVISLQGPAALHRLLDSLATLLRMTGTLDSPSDLAQAARMAGFDVLAAAAPVGLAAILAAVAATLLQSGLLIHLGALMPDLGKISPIAGFKRVFSGANLTQAGLSILKIIVVGGAIWRLFAGARTTLAEAVLWDPGSIGTNLYSEVWSLLMAVLVAQALIAVMDVVWVRLRHARSLRMSRHDIKEEAKEADGNPQVKQRQRQLRAQRSRRRMAVAVREATVVVTNPTHYAVALQYDRTRNAAPRVVAKGMDEMAARIRAAARENNVPIIANPPLARALHLVELDQDIPAEHYQAVAELIAYVWRLQGQVQRRRA